ncbi:hypothetical protein KO500_01085 [Cellulophaga baltica]|uniref:hypothetical protein n=1 Tax=Cellulophaga TaxID=104264 RepID=UPI001C077DF6|nr:MULTISPECIES: hypothetical protein [Cellulophaga]MBU2995002.1 hypothetical protein [Cellulophaga baltica]MDO6766397.1 hypothetical protein [Cellulophaga sp. 1_MG-2023]
MKKSIGIILFVSLFLMSYNTDKKETKNINLEQKSSILENIALANGFKNWKNVKEIQFTFNVDRAGNHTERSWIWNTKTNDVTSKTDKETISYNRGSLTDETSKTNAKFINDKFWLLVPFQLKWDAENFTHIHTKKATAPISNKSMQKLTIVYGNEGGYTPGDAYDLYFGDDYMLKEWVFRKGNQKEPSMVTTWEDYTEINGIKLAQTHKNNDGFKLYFTDLVIK